jgi:toxin ParE1/3/4
MKRIEFDPDARAEFDKGAAGYEQEREGLGDEFMAEVRETLDRLLDNPFMGASYRGSRFRFFPLLRFPYVIYYTTLDDVLWVAAVAHGGRRPGYWRYRQPEQP